MLNAVRSNLFGETGKFLQNFGSALSISFLTLSEFIISFDEDDDKFL